MNMGEPVAVCQSVMNYRQSKNTGSDLLEIDGESWYSLVQAIAGIQIRDRCIRSLKDQLSNKSNFDKQIFHLSLVTYY